MKPQKINDADVVFPGNVSRLMIPMDEIPDDFKGHNNFFCEVQEQWFFGGLKAFPFVEKEGIDRRMAMRHLKAIQGSYQPKHEHKSACVAYLISLWFDKEEGKSDEELLSLMRTGK